jgi:glycosyltransferase involved in cell wall biosynthesis
MKALVSILIPAFNAQTWIAETLRCALGQTWEPKEIIVVDDGSTDRTLAIARQFEKYGVRVYTQHNQGAAAARNKAFALCNGDYIQWLDADDLLGADKIKCQMDVAESLGNPRILLSSPWARFMYRWYRAEFTPSELWCDLSPTEWLLRKLGQNLSMQTATWLTSRELAEAAGPWDTRLLGDDDGEYFCRVLLASEGVRFVPDARVYYRGPALTYSNLSYIQRSSRRLNAEWLSMRLHIQYLRSLEDSDRVRAACLGYLQRYLVYFYPGQSDNVCEIESVARQLGGTLHPPRLSWKYSWIKTFLGYEQAHRVQQGARILRWTLAKWLDKALYRLEGKGRGGIIFRITGCSEPQRTLKGTSRCPLQTVNRVESISS